MVGIGYNDSSNLIYIHDTWDHSVHSMTWGGSYLGMQQYAVTIVIVVSDVPPVVSIKANGSDGPVTIAPGDALSVVISLDSGDFLGKNADWWVYASSPMGPPHRMESILLVYCFSKKWG